MTALPRDLAQFRAEVRNWLASAVRDLPPPPRDVFERRAFDALWQRRLFDAGYAGLSWPEEYGGRAATALQELVFYEECERANAPDIGVFFGAQLFIGPTIAACGAPEQKERYLPPILRGEAVWCQGFSEPNAGSDLASLTTRAERDGNEYVINGQKVWTSYCAVADYCQVLVRTDSSAPRHKGITCVIVPFDTPGLDVRPMRTMVGEEEFGEVFFDEVRVPVENRLGDENEGWRIAMLTLGFERGPAFARWLLRLMRGVGQLRELAQRIPRGDGTAWDDPGFRREIGEYAAHLQALYSLLRANVERADRTGSLGPEGSIFKLPYSEASLRLGELAMHLLGSSALAAEVVGDAAEELVRDGLQAHSMTIAGGTSEVQRNIIAETILGLPR